MKKQKTPLPSLGDNNYLIDTHCHLDMDRYRIDLPRVIESAKDNGVKQIITIGIDLKSSREAIKIAQKYPMVFATVGLHPHDSATMLPRDFEDISELIDQTDRVVAYGEIGLDYAKQYAPPDVQKKVFTDQLAMARNHGLPVIIHDRDAHDEILQIIKQFAPFEKRGVMHCFSGDLEFAKQVMDYGFYISIPGIVTFKNAKVLQQVAQCIPAEFLLLETDGPFLAPVPYRGKRNEPCYLLYVAEQVASLRQTTIDNIASITSNNAMRLFSLPQLDTTP